MKAEPVATVGDIEITRIREYEHQRQPEVLFDDALAVQDAVHDQRWVSEWCDADGRLRLTFQAFLIKTPEHLILLDPCIGNDKKCFIPGTPFRTTFLDDLREAAGDLARIDVIAYTHLHLDHVGWSTHLVDDRWVPTFPWARHIIVGDEWEHWDRGHDPSTDYDRAVDISIRPLLEDELVDLVDADHSIAPGVRLRPTPGHSPGHVSVAVSSGGDEAFITGDLIHHPVQLHEPRWPLRADHDVARGADARSGIVEELAGGPVLLIGTHFAGRCAGHIERDSGGHRFYPVS